MTHDKAVTEDEQEFGRDAWVYCKDHVKPHQTGWCDIGVSHKLSLGTFKGEHAEQARQAFAKCRLFGLPIYGETNANEPQ